MFGPRVYWTELASNEAYSVDTAVAGDQHDQLTVDVNKIQAGDGGTKSAYKAPRAIAAGKDGFCWTYEDSLGSTNGAVVCSFNSPQVVLAEGQRTPRAILMTADASGNTNAVYFANFAQVSDDASSGGIWKVDIANGGMASSPSMVAVEDTPAGLAFDPESGMLYWTSWDNGTVRRVGLGGGAAPEVVATGQNHPGAIVVDKDAIYWVNAGSSGATPGALPDGAIMRLPK